MVKRKNAISDDVQEIDYWKFDENRQVYVTHQKGTLQHNPEFFRPHRLGYFAIRWLIRGEVLAYVDHVPYKLGPDTLMVANPNQISWFEKGAFPSESEVKLIAFSKAYFEELPIDASVAQRLQGTLKHFFHSITSDERSVFESYFDLIDHEHTEMPESVRDQAIAPLIGALLNRISMVTKNTLHFDSGDAYWAVYKNFLDLLETNFRSLHNVDDYVRMLQVNDRKLNRACHSIANTSAGKIIQNRIDFEAKRMLRSGAYSGKEVGYYLGFKDPAHFSKFFKRLNGQPPGKWRA